MAIEGRRAFARELWFASLAVVAALLMTQAASALGSSRTVPPPSLGKTLPKDYRVSHVWHEQLSGQVVPEVVVTSLGPANGENGFHPADLQVLTWDSQAGRWDLTFDAAKVLVAEGEPPLGSNQPLGPSGPGGRRSHLLLDPRGSDEVGQIAFVRFAHQRAAKLVFTAFVGYGGSGVQAALIILSFQQGQANIAYEWVGQDAIRFAVTNTRSGQRLLATAPYWTPNDAHCCPVRSYRFTIGNDKHGLLTSLSDDRAWLGLYVVPALKPDSLGGTNPRSPIRIIGIAARSPSATALHTGDIIDAVKGVAHPRSERYLFGPAIIDEVEAHNAGARLSFLVRRGARTFTVTIRVGSIIDPSALSAEPPTRFNLFVA